MWIIWQLWALGINNLIINWSTILHSAWSRHSKCNCTWVFFDPVFRFDSDLSWFEAVANSDQNIKYMETVRYFLVFSAFPDDRTWWGPVVNERWTKQTDASSKISVQWETTISGSHVTAHRCWKSRLMPNSPQRRREFVHDKGSWWLISQPNKPTPSFCQTWLYP